MLKRFFWTALVAAVVLAGWRFGHQAALKYFFKVSGSVTLAGEVAGALPGANGMLFVIARNERGVPVAVARSMPLWRLPQMGYLTL